VGADDSAEFLSWQHQGGMDAGPLPEYRVGKPRDAAALAPVTIEAFATYREWAPPGWQPLDEPGRRQARLLAERLALPGYRSFVAHLGGEPVGYVVLRPAVTTGDDPQPIPGLAHIWHLFVKPDWWGRGVARRLHNEAVDEARRWKCEAMLLWTPQGNARARGFYAREGWRETGEKRYSEQLDLQLVEYRRPVGA
jgi:GNAT superfamily N-acetyltransferase